MAKSASYLFLIMLCLAVPRIGAQQEKSYIDAGLEFYKKGAWAEAEQQFRLYHTTAQGALKQGEGLYWIALSEMGSGKYEEAVQNMDELIRIAPNSERAREIVYDKGRALFYLGKYNDAIVVLSEYVEKTDAGVYKAAAYYWIGECLYSLGQYSTADTFFRKVTQDYPQSIKFEASSYRIALIQQKKVEEELLNLLKWSHEEALKTVTEYQKREHVYEQSIIAYQKQIADIPTNNRIRDLEASNVALQRRIDELQQELSGKDPVSAETKGPYMPTPQGILPANAEALPKYPEEQNPDGNKSDRLKGDDLQKNVAPALKAEKTRG
jgi:TolA-binding protein